MSLASCTNEESYLEESVESGTMSLSVERLMPQPKNRAVETADYPVAIYRKTDNQQVATYDNVSAMPNKVKLSVGNYYATAHTPGTMEKIMNTPYFSGSEDFEIVRGTNTEATITCRMANGSFSLQFSPDFASVFTSWTVTIDDGGASALVFTYDNDGLTPATRYMRFEENVSTLTVNFKGTTTTGNRIVTSNYLTKQNASEQYDGDSEYFTGGDAIVVKFNPVESTDGEVTGITINANISFEETTEDFELEVKDAELSGGGTSGGDGNTGGGDEENGPITLDLPNDMVITAVTDPSLGDTYIASENGIKSIMVKISSTSGDMNEELGNVPATYPTLTFLTGAEVVENKDLAPFLEELGKTITVPTEGDTEYTFPIGEFFLFLSLLPGEHTFDMVVTDMENNTKNGTIVLTVQ